MTNPTHPSEPSKASNATELIAIICDRPITQYGVTDFKQAALLIEAYAEQVAGERVNNTLDKVSVRLIWPIEGSPFDTLECVVNDKGYADKTLNVICREAEQERDSLRAQLSALKLAGEQGKEALERAAQFYKDDKNGLYDPFMESGIFPVIASLTSALSQSVAPTQAGTRKEGEK